LFREELLDGIYALLTQCFGWASHELKRLSSHSLGRKRNGGGWSYRQQLLTMHPGRRWSQEVAAQHALQAHGFRTSCTAGTGRSHLLFSSNYSALLCSSPEEEALEAGNPSRCWKPDAWEPSFTSDCHHFITQHQTD